MQLIGTYCKNFSELKIMCPFDQDFANALIKYLPKLKVLSLRCTMVYKDALIRILDNLKHLEVLNISHCLFVLVQDSVVTSIMVYRQLDRKIIEKGSQLREFLTCQTGSCSTCQRAAADEGILKWYEYEEARWREDEISSLAHWPEKWRPFPSGCYSFVGPIFCELSIAYIFWTKWTSLDNFLVMLLLVSNKVIIFSYKGFLLIWIVNMQSIWVANYSALPEYNDVILSYLIYE